MSLHIACHTPSLASEEDRSSPSPIHLDGGQVDCRSHIRVPSVGVQSHAPSDDLSISRGPAGGGAEAVHARSPTDVIEKCPDYSNTGFSSRRQASVDSESLPEICDLVPKGGILSE